MQACANCHGPDGTGMPPTYPAIAGQNATHLISVLVEWRHGNRSNDPSGQMQGIAKALDDADIAALVNFYSTQPPPLSACNSSTPCEEIFDDAFARANAPRRRAVAYPMLRHAEFNTDDALMELQKTNGESRIRRSVSIAAPPEQILNAWCSVEALQRVLEPVATLVSGSAEMSRWRFYTPARSHEVVWRRVDQPGAHEVRHRIDPIGALHLSTTLSVSPAPADVGTAAALFVEFHFPGGTLAETAAKMVGMSPHLLAGKTLHRLKALLESGEIPTLRNNPSAREEAKEAA